jgi:hypothetical protein
MTRKTDPRKLSAEPGEPALATTCDRCLNESASVLTWALPIVWGSEEGDDPAYSIRSTCFPRIESDPAFVRSKARIVSASSLLCNRLGDSVSNIRHAPGCRRKKTRLDSHVTRCIYVSVDASSLACEQMKRRPWCPWGEDCDVTIPAQLPLPCWLFVRQVTP